MKLTKEWHKESLEVVKNLSKTIQKIVDEGILTAQDCRANIIKKKALDLKSNQSTS